MDKRQGNLRYQFHRDDLADLLGEVVDSYRNSFSQQSISLETHLPDRAVIDMDPVRIRQLLDNLMQNSLKYTASGGTLSLSLTQQSGQWELLVDDSAPGVPDDALPRLFDHLYRVESSRNRRTGGAGLGLAICQRIVEAHGGTIAAAHSPLGGVRICITLPGGAP